MLWLLAGIAAASECEFVSFKDVVDVEGPTVLVLGERHGHQPDLRRAMRVVDTLARTQPVTLAIEAVHHEQQPVLDAFARGDSRASDLPELMDWDTMWGFRWRPYEPLVTASLVGVKVVAAGLDLGPKPDDAEVNLPSNYMDILRPALAGHDMPLESEQRFVTSMAWRDFGIARAAIEHWDGRGVLVVLTGRGHVEGGKGVTFQAGQLTDAKIQSVVLARGGAPPCWPGDRIWR